MSAEQRSAEWFAERAGKFTGSRFADVLAFGEPKTALCLIAADGSIEKKIGNGEAAETRAEKLRKQGRIVEVREYAPGAPLKAHSDLIWQIAAERISGRPKDQISSQSLAWGTDVEPYAKEAYELETGNTVVEGGFIPHPRYGEFCGVSPDGLVGDDGGIEIKCPKSSEIHLERFIEGVPAEYIPQIQGCMWVTGRKWWDFVSYDPRFSGTPYEMLRIRVFRDESFISKLESAVSLAEKEVQELIQKLNSSIYKGSSEMKTEQPIDKAAQNIAPAASNIQAAAPNIPDSGKTISLGKINSLLSVVTVCRDDLSRLGFDPAGKDRAAILYRASDLRAICNAIAAHVLSVPDYLEQD